jgi:hypothetical protein
LGKNQAFVNLLADVYINTYEPQHLNPHAYFDSFAQILTWVIEPSEGLSEEMIYEAIAKEYDVLGKL